MREKHCYHGVTRLNLFSNRKEMNVLESGDASACISACTCDTNFVTNERNEDP